MFHSCSSFYEVGGTSPSAVFPCQLEVKNFKLLRLSIAIDRDPRALSQNEGESYLSDCEENRNKTKQKNVYCVSI